MGLGWFACRADNPAYNENVTLGGVDGPMRASVRDAAPSVGTVPKPTPAPITVVDAGTEPSVRPPTPLPIDVGPVITPVPVDAAIDLAVGLPTTDPTRFNFETNSQGWADLRGKVTNLRRSTAKPYAGLGSLEIDLVGVDFERFVGVSSGGTMAPPAGASITFRVWIPSGPKYNLVQAFILYFPKGQTTSVWEGQAMSPMSVPPLKTDQWNTFKVTVPLTSTGVAEIGVNFFTSGSTNAKAYIDSVTW